MKSRNAIAIQAGGYTISGSFAAASALSLLSGKGFSSMFYGALSAITAACTDELADEIQPAAAVSGSEPEPIKAGAAKPTKA